MKTLYITIISLLISFLGYSKEVQKLDTIYANDKMNMALFFPSNIKQGITGASHFIFTYNREKGQNLGLLKAIKGEESNLLVITTDGNIYSYIIKYKEQLKNPNHFVSLGERIGNEKALEKSIKLEKNNSVKIHISTTAKKKEKDMLPLRLNSEKLLKLPERKSITKAKKGIRMSIKNVVYKNDNVYLHFEIKNRSGINFDIDFLKVYRINGTKKRKASHQKLQLVPIYMHDLPESVWHGETGRFVYVFSKFTLGDDEKLLVKLQEENGSRQLEFKKGL